MQTISWDDFAKVELRVGRIIKAEEFPQARKPAYIVHVDFGPRSGSNSSAQLTSSTVWRISLGGLSGFVNFPAKQIGR